MLPTMPQAGLLCSAPMDERHLTPDLLADSGSASS
jgi:hypothetical protein